ncbi:transporter substrate-binding domain-containing protein [Phenylobacterium sp.]|uniref:ABC transporter substrate-binding protein n=1 Tax=Phenylobacterium sp. TaxID=1871053 RepID=UPI0035B01D8A
MTLARGQSRRALLAGLGAAALAPGCARTPDARVAGGFVVGSTATGVPFSFYDVRTNELTGAMVDIARAVAAQAGFPVEVQATAFSALIPSLRVGKIDLIAAAMLRTPAREAVVAFSDPVYAYGGAIVARAGDARRYPDLPSLRGRRVGAQVGARFVDQLSDAGVSGVRTYDNLADILRDLRLGRLDAAYGDEPIIRYYLRVTRTRALRLAEEFAPGEREQVCLILRKEDTELAARVNAAIAEIKATRIAAIVRQWGL